VPADAATFAAPRNNIIMSYNSSGSTALKVGVFYDGSYFNHVSNYYNYVHPHRRRLHIGGLHEFIKHMVAERENTRPSLCHIIDAHFFRGRFSARDAMEKTNQLYYDRVFDDVLMYNGVQPHYLPVKDQMGRKREKGIDVLMALETFELCMLKRFDVVALVASDGDHVALVRKLHALGCKTMLLGWDFEFTDQESGELQTTKTSTDLWNEVSYPLPMHDLIEEGLKEDDEVIKDVFVVRDARDLEPEGERPAPQLVDDTRHRSTIMSLMNGYGFIRFPDNNVFFRHEDLEGIAFEELSIGDELEFHVAINHRGQRQAKHITRPSAD
jgi:uncharacterized LabA/DUF88 family protein/cold shock CspA family protein